MNWFDEDGCFDIEKVKDTEKLIDICRWVNNHADYFWDEDRTIAFTDTHTIIGYSWEDYCRGCFMGTEHEEIKIPNEIFFSNYDLGQWQREENERIRKKKEAKEKRQATLEKKRKEKEAKVQKLKREEKDRKDYMRLKKKFEEGDK